MKKRLLALLLAVTMVAALVACGSSSSSSSSSSTTDEVAVEETAEEAEETEETAESGGYEGDLEYVELDWYSPHTDMTDNDMVQEAINEYLLEKLNCNVTFHFLGESYNDTMATKISAGEDVGIFAFQEGFEMSTYVGMGAVYPMTDLFADYAPGTYELFSEDQWQSMVFDGDIYAIPSLKDNAYMMSVIYNVQLADDIGLDMSDFHFGSWRELEDLLMEVKEKDNELYPEGETWPIATRGTALNPYYFAVEQMRDYYAVCNIPGIMTIDGYDEDTVFNLYATDEFREFCLSMQRMVQANVYAWDYDDFDDYRYKDWFFARQGFGYVYIEPYQFQDEFPMDIVMSDYFWASTDNYQGAANAISINCKDPERAMMVLELANTDSDFATLLRFGIEGTHWVRTEDGDMSFEGTRNEDSTNRGWYYWYGAYFGNLTIVQAPSSIAGPNNEVMNNIKEYNEEAYTSAHMGFTFDQTPVANEAAACDNVVAEYAENLICGRFDTPEEVEASLDAFLEKLEANGVQTIIDEAQAQIDAWSN